MVKSKKMKTSKKDVIFNIIVYALMGILMIIFLYPLVYVISASMTSPSDILTGKMWLWPTSFSFAGYKHIIEYTRFWTGYLNSAFLSVAGTALSLVLTFMAGYVLSLKNLLFKKPIMWIFTVTMFFNGGMIPTYNLICGTLNLGDSYWALILPSAVSVWNIILVRTYYISSIPAEMYESASLDGCGHFRYFILISIPLALPILAVITLYNVVGRWNAYFDALLYLDTPEKYPLQLVIRNLLAANQMGSVTDSGGFADVEYMLRVESMKFGVIILSSLPMLIMYPFVQKYFIKGILVGSLKG